MKPEFPFQIMYFTIRKSKHVTEHVVNKLYVKKNM